MWGVRELHIVCGGVPTAGSTSDQLGPMVGSLPSCGISELFLRFQITKKRYDVAASRSLHNLHLAFVSISSPPALIVSLVGE